MLRNPRLRIGLILIVLAGGGFLGIRKYMGKGHPGKPGRGGPRMVQVVVASADIQEQTILTDSEDLVRLELMKADEAGRYLQAKSKEEIKGWVTKYPIARDLPIPEASIAGKIDQLGVSYLIPQGKRAMIIDLKKAPNFFDLIKATDHVDIVATYPDGESPIYSRTIVSDALVLAVNSYVVESVPSLPGEEYNVAVRGLDSPAEKAKAQQAQQQAAKSQGKAGGKGGETQQQQQQPPPPPHNLTLALSVQDAMAIAVSNKAMLDVILRARAGVGFAPMETGEATPEMGGNAGKPLSGDVRSSGVSSLSTPSASGGSVRLAAKGPGAQPGIALVEIAPPLKNLPQKGAAGQRAAPITPPPPRKLVRIPLPPRFGSVPPFPGGAIRPLPPPKPTVPDTYDVQVFSGGSHSSVPVKIPRN